jgi:4-diphosphocytidyl-2-C-methyl-D-erythritol kinase
MSAEYQAPAKLNLGLRLLARRPDGYHEIETVLLPLALYDRVRIERRSAPGLELTSDDPSLPCDAANLAWRAAERACKALGVAPALSIRLEKRIPVAAGLGGGSSDAAAALALVESLHGRRLPEAERRAAAHELGADVPFFLDPRPALARGVGERLEPLDGVPPATWLLVVFPFGVSTRDAYAAASAELTLEKPATSIAALRAAAGLPSLATNDLETVVARRHPEIAAARRALEQVGASQTGMSGSGPTVYGRFPDAAACAEASRRARLPGGTRTIVASSPGSGARGFEWGVAKR